MNNLSTRIENQLIINSIKGNMNSDAIDEYIKMNVKHLIEKPVIWDFTEASLSEVTVADMKKFVDRLKPLSEVKRVKKTAIVSLNALHLGVLSFLKSLTEKNMFASEFKIFKTIIEAKEWLLK
jgi:hypothetical protein